MRVAALLVFLAVLAGGVWAGGRLLGDEDDARSYSRVLDAVAEGGILHTHIEIYVKDGIEMQFRCPDGEGDVPGRPYVRSEYFTADSWFLIGRDGLPIDALSVSHDSGGERVLSVHFVGDDGVVDFAAVGLVCAIPDAREPVIAGGPTDPHEVFRRGVQQLRDDEESGEARREPSDVDGTFVVVQEGTVCDSQILLDIEPRRVVKRRLVLESDYTLLNESCSEVAEGARELLIESYESTYERLDASEWPALLDLVFPEGPPAVTD
jgi:hypothetical protein